jgi:hypothetical protein
MRCYESQEHGKAEERLERKCHDEDNNQNQDNHYENAPAAPSVIRVSLAMSDEDAVCFFLVDRVHPVILRHLVIS